GAAAPAVNWSGKVTSQVSVWIDQVVPGPPNPSNRPHPPLRSVIIILGTESDHFRYGESLRGEGGRMSYGILWIVLILAIVSVAAGAVTVSTGRVAVPWLRGRVIWQRWGWAMVALGLFMVLEAAPRLAGSSD